MNSLLYKEHSYISFSVANTSTFLWILEKLLEIEKKKKNGEDRRDKSKNPKFIFHHHFESIYLLAAGEWLHKS